LASTKRKAPLVGLMSLEIQDDRLFALRLFARVARKGSFSAAGRELNIPQSTAQGGEQVDVSRSFGAASAAPEPNHVSSCTKRCTTRVYGAAVMYRLRAMGIRDKPIAPARQRPCGGRAAEQSDELSACHSITSSASASTAGGIVRLSALAVIRLND
jgi:hypothetical protein